MFDDIAKLMEDDEDDVVVLDLHQVANIIAATMGGSAERYAVEQLGENLHAIVFGDQQVVTALEYVEADEPFPQNANAANVFTSFASRALH